MHALAKLMLNSFWGGEICEYALMLTEKYIFVSVVIGKFAQYPNIYKTKEIQKPQVVFDYLMSDETVVLCKRPCSESSLPNSNRCCFW